ncbi:MAG: 4-vinyl reductase [Candidatus Competibacteraceae bacterium]|nr:4-vinyl reductase [Candidatus Competibacteraceae bacterium]MBK7982331.1 4-vinyl reductase [Candidatus Competibacteraceae bacterium]MBK8899119.1 4-vinyl reductase [Candidatus Competibacteraceae bacterium]MBK8963159.1 4-vinyl reductase [Candidatus Competibacteraceae bacterium]MBK9952121.1 4-vinyl reductase [Candidatus Competibacteraceae bacterium]
MIPSFGENYSFQWDDLGDIELGRPNLGQSVPVVVYRLAQYTMREVLAQRYGDAAAAEMLQDAGWIAGREFCLNLLDRHQSFSTFIMEVQDKLRELGIGVLRVEKANLDNLLFTMTVSEDLDCSGLPLSGTTVCDYDEGFIAGLLYTYTGKPFSAKEVDCWATGDRTCRFDIKPDLKVA